MMLSGQLYLNSLEISLATAMEQMSFQVEITPLYQQTHNLQAPVEVWQTSVFFLNATLKENYHCMMHLYSVRFKGSRLLTSRRGCEKRKRVTYKMPTDTCLRCL